jgi:membrane-bound lytic murein transglycosylase D
MNKLNTRLGECFSTKTRYTNALVNLNYTLRLKMMHVDINRSINFLLILLAILITGCSGTSEKPFTLDDQATQNESTDTNSYLAHNPKVGARLRFAKNKAKTGLTQQNTVWDRLLSLYSLPEVEHYRIDQEVNWYLQHPTSLAIIQQRAEPYLHHILDEIEAKHIPGELALLPVVESSFIPDAYSHADASGLWQFVPATGEEYGLQQNAWYDGRRDIYTSTKAATTYLKELSDTFHGDWLLALASYNCGKGRVRKSIEKNEDNNLPTDYWSLTLPQETVDYVPKLLAIAKIFANADEYNIHLQHIPNKPFFEVINIKEPLDLHIAAQLANTPYDKFIKLNPGYSRSCTAPQGPHHLLIPVDKAQSFKTSLAKLPANARVDLVKLQNEIKSSQSQAKESKNTVIYRVNAGDSLLAIAKRFHTSANQIRQSNHLTSNTVKLGMALKIDGKLTQTNLLSILPNHAKSVNQFYVVKKGDTFVNIGQRFSTPPKAIAEWNQLSVKSALMPGKKIIIKSLPPQLASSSPVRLIQYVVHPGDTLTQIAKKFNLTLADLRKNNLDVLQKGLQPGQKLKILIDSRSST